MKKIILVLKREYLSRVKKKSFLLTTFLIPFLIIGFYLAIIAVAVSGTKHQKIAVIDNAQLFGNTIPPEGDFTFQLKPAAEAKQLRTGYASQGFDGVLILPANTVDSPANIKVYGNSLSSPIALNELEKFVARTIENKRMINQHIDPAQIKSLRPDISLNPIETSGKDNQQKDASKYAHVAGFAAGILIYFILLIYGTMVMRGVSEEKINRIAEVIVSSVKPFQLMLGKILGIGLVGLTQFIIWMVLILVLQQAAPHFFPQTGAGAALAQGATGSFASVLQGLEALNFPLIIGCFLFYFIGGYLMFASLFAMIGSAVSDDAQEAQQMMMPITMLIVLSFVIMTKAVADPTGNMAVFGSIFPLTSPIVMMGRIPYGLSVVPVWQLVASMALLIACFIFTTWIAAKIYRTGILMYGKKVTFKEMLKWAWKKN